LSRAPAIPITASAFATPARLREALAFHVDTIRDTSGGGRPSGESAHMAKVWKSLA